MTIQVDKILVFVIAYLSNYIHSIYSFSELQPEARLKKVLMFFCFLDIMKYFKKLSILTTVGFLAGILPLKALAKTNVYPLSNRALFLAGCLTEDTDIDLQNQDEVYTLMRLCICLLDKFQVTYTNTEFITLFDQVERQDSAAQQELDHFSTKYYPSCL